MKKLFTSDSPVICEHYHGYNPDATQCIKCVFKDKEIDAINAKGGINGYKVSSHSFVDYYCDDKIDVAICENCHYMSFGYYKYQGQDPDC